MCNVEGLHPVELFEFKAVELVPDRCRPCERRIAVFRVQDETDVALADAAFAIDGTDEVNTTNSVVIQTHAIHQCCDADGISGTEPVQSLLDLAFWYGRRLTESSSKLAVLRP